ncbi:hypothetical protein WMZ97_10135 [Lentibacillus sp. N15]|uniref:hypothetical protein n=1 Tax=Lentibacillus songyuanensis TaxID=3136161 RepID=UPI0031BB3316
MKKDKAYWKEIIECYVFCFSLFLLFLAVMIISGQLTGTDWIGLFKQLYRTSF